MNLEQLAWVTLARLKKPTEEISKHLSTAAEEFLTATQIGLTFLEKNSPELLGKEITPFLSFVTAPLQQSITSTLNRLAKPENPVASSHEILMSVINNLTEEINLIKRINTSDAKVKIEALTQICNLLQKFVPPLEQTESNVHPIKKVA